MPLEMDNKIITTMPKFSLCSINKKKAKSHHFQSNFVFSYFKEHRALKLSITCKVNWIVKNNVCSGKCDTFH